MNIKVGPMTCRTIGDPHLGRKFEVGVPIPRRGEREVAVIEDFKSRLQNNSGIDFSVCMGDIFDKFIVEPEYVLAADDAYRGASIPEYLIMGNHDGSRFAGRRSSFDALTRMVEAHRRVTVVRDVPMFIDCKHATILLIPWHPFMTAREMAEIAHKDWVSNGKPKIDAAFGHWDVDDYGDLGTNNDNVVPVGTLRKMTKQIITGHVHTPGKKVIADVEVIITGSMQPYTHGEDPNHDTYLTVSLEELRQLDPATLKDKCIRVALEDGEELPSDIDCLQLTRYQRKVRNEKGEVEEVRIEEFDMQRLLDESLADGKVPPEAQEKIRSKFKEMSP
jgi:DNA repair exonuclease SbcCD nuclease subunit